VQKLVVFRGDAVEKEIRLVGTTVRIGRDERNELVLEDPSKGVSRFHAELRPEAGKYFVVDLKSRNGVWINEQRIQGKAVLALGVPVILGPYELVLEDDVSTTGFDGAAPTFNQHTVLNAGSVNQKERSSPRAASPQSVRSPGPATKRRAFVWAGGAASVLIVCGVLSGVAWHIYRQTHTVVATAAPPPPPPPEPSPPPQPSAEDPTRKAVDQHLADAREQMAAGDYAGAMRDHLQPALDLDPGNTDALELKQRAEAAISEASAAPKPTRSGASPLPPVVAETETPGIPRRANEPYADYTVRVKRIELDLAEGKISLDKKDYVAAISRFRSVEREQPRYQGVDLLITEARNKQQKAFDEAMDSGLQSEQAQRWKVARQSYQTASRIDPTSTTAREKADTIRNRTLTDAKKLDTQASLARKTQETETAVRYYRQILELLLPGDELFDNASKELEALKR